MKKNILFFLSMFIGTTGFAESFVLNNTAPYPASNHTSKMAIQWATSARDVDDNNNIVRKGLTLNPDSLKVLTQVGSINLDIPKKAEYLYAFGELRVA